MEQFCNAIRAKDDWVTKILDEQRGLAVKWAIEANLLAAEDDAKDRSNPVVKALECVLVINLELKTEARRIHLLDDTIRVDCNSLPLREINFDEIDGELKNALKDLRISKYAIRRPVLKEEVGVCTSDGITPKSLHRELIAELNALAARTPKDFHPGSYGMVQDLIHPSLYPFIAGITTSPSGEPLQKDGKFRTHHTIGESVDPQVIEYESLYSWIPSVFRISEDGKDVHIDSYINGLGSREDYPTLYCLIEKLFLLALPQFERTLEFEYSRQMTPSEKRWTKRSDQRYGTTRSEWADLLAQQQAEKVLEEEEKKTRIAEGKAAIWAERSAQLQFNNIDETQIASSFKGQELKVIVKAANYIMGPGQEYSGTWHMEGMPHERIAASLIYYYESDNAILDEGLGFSRFRDPEVDFPRTDEHSIDDFIIQFRDEEPDDAEFDLPSDFEDSSLERLRKFILLGTVPTTATEGDLVGHGTGRMISFPNWILHRVMGLRNVATSSGPVLQRQPAERKILCFFLVQEGDLNADEIQFPTFRLGGLRNMRVLTTSDVAQQARYCNDLTLHFILPVACRRLTGKLLPPELIDNIINSVDLGWTRLQAEHHRLNLMEDRRIEPKGWNDDSYSLCEH